MGDPNWGNMFKAGAAGAGAGSAFGPLGSAIGGFGGMLFGATDLFDGGGDGEKKDTSGTIDDPRLSNLGGANQSRYGKMATEAQGRSAYEMQFNPELRQSLTDAAMGRVPSAAEAQLGMGLDRILASQMAARASGRGGSIGAANRLVAGEANRAKLDVAGQAAQLRAQEQAQARGLAAGVEGDIGQANLQAQIQNQQQIDQMTQYYMSLGANLDEANRQARMEIARMQMERDLAEQGFNVQREGAIIGAGGALLSGVAGAAPALAAVSDVRAKQNIKKVDSKIEKLLDAISPYEFDYKDPKHGGAKNIGIMAQDLKKSDAGKHIVIDGPVKMVDLKRALMASLAANAHLHKRVKRLEK